MRNPIKSTLSRAPAPGLGGRCRILEIAAALLFLTLAGAAFADTTWTAPGVSANWSTAANWNNGVPAGGANVFRAAVPVNGNAVLPIAASSYAVEISLPTSTNDITLSGNTGHATTLNVNAALTTLGMAEGNPLGALAMSGGTNPANAVINIGYVPVSLAASINISGSTLNILAGGTLTFGEGCPNQGIRTSSSIINVYGALNGTSGGQIGNSGLTLEGGGGSSTCNIDGGYAVFDTLVILSNVGQATLTVRNGGSLSVRPESKQTLGIVMGNIWNSGAAGYPNTSVLNLMDGTITNGSAASGKQFKLCISELASAANGPGSGSVNISGGTFYQYGITYIGSGRNGSLNVSGTGNFSSTNTILVGGTNNTYSIAPTGAATASGTLALSGGSLNAASIKIGDGSFAALGGTQPVWSTAGTLNLSGGTLTTSSLTATNGTNSVIHFTGGTLNTESTAIANGSLFTVGNGTLAATLNLNGGSHSFANNISLSDHATLTGWGTITSGTLTVTNGSTVSPGTGIGMISTAATTWSGGTYQWEILSPFGTPASEWDYLSINGVLNITAGAGGFVINLDSPGALPGWDKRSPQSWPIAAASGGITGFQQSKFTVQSGNFSNNNPIGGGKFSVALANNDLNLVFTPGAPIQSWREDNSLPLDGSGIGTDNYDASGNGIPNLMKYALGMAASSTSLAGSPVVSVVAGRLEISFQRDPALTDIDYIVEASSDLGGLWTPIASSTAGGSISNLGGAFSVAETGSTLRQVTVNDLPLIISTTKRFLRLKILRH